MKLKRILAIPAAAGAAALSLLAIAPQAHAWSTESPSWGAANLISYGDSDFESGVGNWVSYSNSTVSQDTTQAFLHDDSLQMTSGTSGSQAVKMGTGTNAPQVNVTGGDTYKESAWVKLPSALSGRTVTFANGFYTSSGTWLGWTSGSAVTLSATTSWQYVEDKITAPSTAAYMVGSPRITEANVAASESLNLDEIVVAPDRSATIIGAEDTGGNGVDFSSTNTAIGPLQSDKIFYSASSSLPSSYTGSYCANLPANVTCLISYKVQTTNVASYVGSIPAGRNVIFIFWQEPEATFSGGASTYVSDFETQASLIRSSTTSSNRANVFVAADANGYQYDAGSGHNDGGAGGSCGFTPPASSVDFYLGDFYEPTASGDNINTDSSVSAMWQGWLGCVSPQDKPIGIAEYGLNYTCNGCANALSTSQAFAADNTYLEADPDGLPVMMWEYWYDNNANGYFEFTAGGSPDGTQAVDQWQSDETQNGGGAN